MSVLTLKQEQGRAHPLGLQVLNQGMSELGFLTLPQFCRWGTESQRGWATSARLTSSVLSALASGRVGSATPSLHSGLITSPSVALLPGRWGLALPHSINGAGPKG